ncbi:MAG: hypothetical protein JSU00_06595 [Acidobacteria bacterium]|nr:hypothetical protein [Acidobacteriota bacterium]
MPENTIASFDDVLRQEVDQLRARRSKVLSCDEPAHPGESPAAQAIRFRPFGMGISGGGIRSATFNLGILQGLAAHGVLPYIDYLSTVSGGGYVGSWLHGVIQRKCGGDPRQLIPTAGDSPIQRRVPGPPAEDPVNYLRNYSNYLAPRRGALGVDNWVILSIWLRNMFLNQLILIPFLTALLTLTLLAARIAGRTPGILAGTILSALAFVMLFVAVVNAGRNLRAIVATQFAAPGDSPPPIANQTAWPTVLGVVASSVLIYSLHWTPIEDILPAVPWITPWELFLASMWILHLTLQLGGGFLECHRAQHPKSAAGPFHTLWMSTLSAIVTTALLCAVTQLVANASGGEKLLREHGAAWNTVIWGPPLVLVVIIWGVSLQIGLMGVDFPDASREWLARIGAVLSIVIVLWTAFTAIALYGPYSVAWLAVNYGATAVAAIATWAGGAYVGVRSANNSTTGGDDKPSKGVKDTLLGLAPTFFIIGLLILIAAGIHLGLAAITGATPTTPAPATHVTGYQQYFQPLAPFLWRYNAVLESDAFPMAAGLILLVTGAIALLLPLRVNINEFSLHHFYKNRLVRCYMGAGHPNRQPNPFTGFDPKDDILLNALHPAAGYHGPYPILNTALNLSAGSELSKQERQATSFVFTPLYCGFDPPTSTADAPNSRLNANGYYPTIDYTAPGGPHIGTAMAISGAAANPNGGYHTSPSVAFLLSLFNVRLGWWVGNPRIQCAPSSDMCPPRRPGPLYGLLWLIWELLGRTTGRSSYVNLSDGGHFENLGLYELIRRRCRYIIIGDGEEDPHYTFESLGGAIRKCRADFGVEIDIDVDQIQAKDSTRRAHCVVGTVTYPEDAPSGQTRATGWILYLKASLTSDEPQDVQQYHEFDPVFPQQPTTDQFFTESQFESYRRLGLHIVDSAFENAPSSLKSQLDARAPIAPADLHVSLDNLFGFLAALWRPPVNVPTDVVTRMNDAYTRLTTRLCNEPELAFLDVEVLGGSVGVPPPIPTDPAALRKATFFVLDLIQLTENVWFEFRLQGESNRTNPKNSGWMTVFRQWVRAPFIGGVWRQVKGNYNPLFVSFMDDLARR